MSRHAAAARQAFARAVQGVGRGGVLATTAGAGPTAPRRLPESLEWDGDGGLTRLGGYGEIGTAVSLTVTITATATVTIGLENE